MATITLKPCPFCGVVPEMGRPGGRFGVWCLNENCLAQPMAKGSSFASEAAANWNQRAASHQEAGE